MMQTISVPYSFASEEDRKAVELCVKAQNYAKKVAYNIIHEKSKNKEKIDLNKITQDIMSRIQERHHVFKQYITAATCMYAVMDMQSMYEKRKISYFKTQERRHQKREASRFDRAVFHERKRLGKSFNMDEFNKDFKKIEFVFDESKMPKIVFGGKDLARRRSKKLIQPAEFKKEREHALLTFGDSGYKGNRTFKLSEDGKTCSFKVPYSKQGEYINLQIGYVGGTWKRLLLDLARLAPQKEVPLTFSLKEKRLNISFNPMDLRKLKSHETLTAVKDAEGSKKKGRKRGEGYKVPLNKEGLFKPVHPNWKDRIDSVKDRVMGIDLNPEWIGCSIVEADVKNYKDLSKVKILSHNLFNITVPRYYAQKKKPHAYFGKVDSLGRKRNGPFPFPKEVMVQTLSEIAEDIIMFARSYNVGTITLESGLGYLQSRTKNKSLNQRINGWGRTIFKLILERKAEMAGIRIVEVYAAYSSTIGNCTFNLPDACASAVEIGRRGIVLTSSSINEREMLPDVWENPSVLRLAAEIESEESKRSSEEARGGTILTEVHRSQKNSSIDESIDDYIHWRGFHGKLKRLSIRYRRPHPDSLLTADYVVSPVNGTLGRKFTEKLLLAA